MALPGWHRVSGTSRFIAPSGAEVSRRQYDNARARDAGYSSYSNWQRTSKSGGYRHYGNASQRLETLGNPKSLASQFAREFAKVFLGADGQEKPKGQISLKAHGEYATFLEDLGIRDEGADYDVGETPGAGK